MKNKPAWAIATWFGCGYFPKGPGTAGSAAAVILATPAAAIPGGELQIRGSGLGREPRPRVSIGDIDAPIVIGSDSYMIVRVPDGASGGNLVVSPNGESQSNAWTCDIGIQIVDSIHA